MSKAKNKLQRNMSNPQDQDNLVKTFSFRLSYAILVRKTTQAELASACGMAASHISQYINKNTIPRIEKIKLIAEKLHVSELWLMGDGHPYDIDQSQCSDLLSPDERILLKAYQGTSQDVKNFLVDLAKAYEQMKREE